MNDTSRRFLGYGTGLAVVGGLVAAMQMYRPEADFMTLVSSANTQLQVAATIPAEVDDAGLRAERQRLIVEVNDLLDRAEKIEPESIDVFVVRATARWVAGDHRASAALYRRAGAAASCEPGMRDRLALRRARVLLAGGFPDEAIVALDELRADGELDGRVVAAQLRATALHASARTADASAALQSFLSDHADELRPEHHAAVGVAFEDVGDRAAAEAVYGAAAAHLPVANYYLARLKMRCGENDRAIEFLGVALNADAERTREFAQADAGEWQEAAATDARIGSLLDNDQPAQPGR